LACRRGGRVVFVGVSFVLSPGGALVLTGANGSGKSSLLRLAAGLLVPAAGRLLWGTTPILDDAPAHHARLHYVGHQDALKPALTPREMLTFWAALRGIPRRRAARAADGALAMFALDMVADWPCRWLSAGQRRRVALARLLAAPAPLWLLDEPTSALDAERRARLEESIAAHRAAGGMAMLATHDPVALPGATVLALDNFAPRIGDLAADVAL
jgi:heme exporter protein A